MSGLGYDLSGLEDAYTGTYEYLQGEDVDYGFVYGVGSVGPVGLSVTSKYEVSEHIFTNFTALRFGTDYYAIAESSEPGEWIASGDPEPVYYLAAPIGPEITYVTDLEGYGQINFGANLNGALSVNTGVFIGWDGLGPDILDEIHAGINEYADEAFRLAITPALGGLAGNVVGKFSNKSFIADPLDGGDSLVFDDIDDMFDATAGFSDQFDFSIVVPMQAHIIEETGYAHYFADYHMGTDGEETLTAGSDGEVLDGGLGDDRLIGGGGSDMLLSYSGFDTLNGKDGYDTVSFRNREEEIVLALGDYIEVEDGRTFSAESIDGYFTDVAKLRNVEGIIGSYTKQNTIYGDQYSNQIVGGMKDDTILASYGNDVISGGLGSDYLNGGDHSDTVTYSYRTSRVIVNLTTGGNTEDDTLVKIENVVGTSYRDILKGSSDDNSLTGAQDDDRLFGYAGDDSLFGGSGDDSLEGGSGADYLEGSIGDDWISGDAGDDKLVGDYGQDKLYGGENDDRLYGKDDDDWIEGGSGNDGLYGGRGDDRLYSGTGHDSMYGHSGDDYLRVDGFTSGVIDGGSGVDTLSYSKYNGSIFEDVLDFLESGQPIESFVSDGIDANLETGVASNGGTLSNIENLYGSDFGRDKLVGSDGDNVLKGLGADDRLYGKGGDDLLYGGDGMDRVFGSDGDDRLYGGSGEDYLDGGNGDDILYGGSGADVFRFDHDEENDRIINFENNVDRIELAGFGFADVDEAMSYATVIGDDVKFDFGGDDSLIVRDVTRGQLMDDLEIL